MNHPYNGLINIYKEPGWTSMDVCAKLRRLLHMKKIGHAGTLDPMAEGVLPVALGRATKDVDSVGDGTKVYEASMLLGLRTDTEDITGRVMTVMGRDADLGTKRESGAETDEASGGSSPGQSDTESGREPNAETQPGGAGVTAYLEGLPASAWPSEERIREAVLSFLGPYDQRTPMYSARKVNGKKLYEYARTGVEVERKVKRVEILAIELLEIRAPHVRFRVQCTRGTYIRTLCSDIGERLGVGASMESLRRLAVGSYEIGDAHRLSEVEELLSSGGNLDGWLTIAAPTAISLGKFDGAHLGHQTLFRELKKTAEKEHLRTCALILRFGKQGVMTAAGQKEHLYRQGLDYCIELPFTESMKTMSAEDFLEKILIGRYHMKAIVAGNDVSFGYQKRGNADFLREHAAEYGYKVHLIEKVKIDLSKDAEEAPGPGGEDISSTLLRKELQKGDMLHVTRLLGAPYAITGTVIHGRHLGTDAMRLPTMNVQVPAEQLLPPYGVYAVTVHMADAKGRFAVQPDEALIYSGIANLGIRPTVGGTKGGAILETHVFGDPGECYGREIRVELRFFIRPEEKFADLSALSEHLRTQDIPAVEAFFRQNGKTLAFGDAL